MDFRWASETHGAEAGCMQVAEAWLELLLDRISADRRELCFSNRRIGRLGLGRLWFLLPLWRDVGIHLSEFGHRMNLRTIVEAIPGSNAEE